MPEDTQQQLVDNIADCIRSNMCKCLNNNINAINERIMESLSALRDHGVINNYAFSPLQECEELTVIAEVMEQPTQYIKYEISMNLNHPIEYVRLDYSTSMLGAPVQETELEMLEVEGES